MVGDRHDCGAVKGRAVDEPEPAVIRAAAAGDLDAFESLVRMQQLPVWRFLRQFLGDAELAEDVAQETFLRVYRHLPSFAFQSKFTTWTFQIARNAGVDAIRSRERRDKYERLTSEPAPPAEPARSVEVAWAIGSLDDRQREALLVVEVFGLSYREAATVLGVPEGTVKSRVFLARKAMAALMPEEDHRARRSRRGLDDDTSAAGGDGR